MDWNEVNKVMVYCMGSDEDRLRDYFALFGTVKRVFVNRDTATGRHMGFGFVVFAHTFCISTVLQYHHYIDGHKVEVRRTLSRERRYGSAWGTKCSDARNFDETTIGKKILITGFQPTISEEQFRGYFEAYGTVVDVLLVCDQLRKESERCGFGFISFDSEDAIDKVSSKTFHDLDGNRVEVKRVVEVKGIFPEEANADDLGHSVGGAGTGPNAEVYEGKAANSGNGKTKKIFVGGLSRTVTEEGFRRYFEAYGTVSDAMLMYDQRTQKRPRGFGFITFYSDDTVDRVLRQDFHELNGKQVEVKLSYPKDADSGCGSRSKGSSGIGGSRGYEGYGAPAGGSNTYDSFVPSNTHIWSEDSRVGFQPHCSSVYGAAGYAYDEPNGVGSRNLKASSADYWSLGFNDDISLGWS